MFNRQYKANKQNLKNTFYCFRYFITGVALMTLGIISSCATTSFTYADKGVFLTSDPSVARVEMLVKAIFKGHLGGKKIIYITPVHNPNDRFVLTATRGNEKMELWYKFTVSKYGYKTITQEIKGEDIRPVMHWVLEPIENKKEAAASGYGEREKWGEIGPIESDRESDRMEYTEPHERLEVKTWGITLRYVRSSPFGIGVTVYDGGQPNTITDVWGIEAIYKEITTGENYSLSLLKHIPFSAEIRKLSEPKKGESIRVELDYNFLASLYRATGLYELAKEYERSWNRELEMRKK